MIRGELSLVVLEVLNQKKKNILRTAELLQYHVVVSLNMVMNFLHYNATFYKQEATRLSQYCNT